MVSTFITLISVSGSSGVVRLGGVESESEKEKGILLNCAFKVYPKNEYRVVSPCWRTGSFGHPGSSYPQEWGAIGGAECAAT